jgi:hypothetical protein
MQIWYVRDTNSDVESSNITHVTDKDYGSLVVFEPYPYTMPGCEDQFDNGTTVLQFYLHMEEATHVNRLFGTSNHTCSFGCEKGSLNVHSLLRHYLSGDCQHLRIGEIPTLIPSRLSHKHDITCKLCSSVYPDRQAPSAHCIDFRALVASSLSYAQKLEINGNLWVVPSIWIYGLPSRELLCRLYNGGQGGHYAIFLYCDSSHLSHKENSDDSKNPLLIHSRHFLKILR